MLNPAIKAVQDKANELFNSNFENRAENLLNEIIFSNISPSYVEVKIEFLKSFSGKFGYCKTAIFGNTELWEKKEYLQVIEGDVEELKDMEVWFSEMKEMNLA